MRAAGPVRVAPAPDPWEAYGAVAGTEAAGAPDAAPPQPAPQPDPTPPRRRFSLRRREKPAEAAAARLRAMDDPPADPPIIPAAPSPLGPARAPLEGLGGLAVLLALDIALGARGFAHWPVHPFALPVLYVAARWGVWSGLTVALAAGVMRLGLALVNDHYTATTWAEPVAWIAAAALVGAVVERHRRRVAAAEAAAETAIAERTAVVESNDRLAIRAVELEARLGTRLAAATAVFEAARALGHDTGGVIRGAPGLVRAATGCAACSFWLLERDGLRLVAQTGWPEGAALPHSIPPGPLTEALARRRGALVVTRMADRAALGEHGLLAASVPSPWDGTPLGMVRIEDIGFTEFSSDTVAGLEAAAGWLGAALAEVGDGGGGLVAGVEASRAIGMMTGVARRVGFDLALLSAEVPDGPRAGAALEAVRAAMTEVFRGSDLLLESRLDERRVSVLLPGTAVADAEAATARLRAGLAERAPAATAEVGVTVAWLHGAAR